MASFECEWTNKLLCPRFKLTIINVSPLLHIYWSGRFFTFSKTINNQINLKLCMRFSTVSTSFGRYFFSRDFVFEMKKMRTIFSSCSSLSSLDSCSKKQHLYLPWSFIFIWFLCPSYAAPALAMCARIYPTRKKSDYTNRFQIAFVVAYLYHFVELKRCWGCSFDIVLNCNQ